MKIKKIYSVICAALLLTLLAIAKLIPKRKKEASK